MTFLFLVNRPALEIDTAQKLPLFSLLWYFLEYKLTFDSTSGCMQLQISADSFVFSCVLSATDSFLDQDDFAELHRIFQFIKKWYYYGRVSVHQNNDIMKIITAPLGCEGIS